MTELGEAVPLLASQKARAGQVLGRVFSVDPAYTALFPDDLERAQALPRLLGAIIGCSLVCGLVHTTPEVEGAACRLSPRNTEVTLWRILGGGMGLCRAVGRPNPRAWREFLAVMDHLDGGAQTPSSGTPLVPVGTGR
jgi:hypothetical protein